MVRLFMYSVFVMCVLLASAMLVVYIVIVSMCTLRGSIVFVFAVVVCDVVVLVCSCVRVTVVDLLL